MSRTFTVFGHQVEAPSLAPGLHLVATPIGNLGDVTLRALGTLAGADAIACEDTRVTAKLLARYEIRRPLVRHDDHADAHARAALVARMAGGEAIALCSDAGSPLLSDPGFPLVREAIAAGIAVVPVPGASALVAALMGAGLPTDAVHFAGFLPQKAGGRHARLEALRDHPATLVFFEAPGRLGAMLADAADVLGGARPAVVARELTKLHETFQRGTLADLATAFADAAPKGEIVVMVGPPAPAASLSPQAIDRLLSEALARGSVKTAAEEVAEVAGIPRRDAYRRALALKDGAP